MIALSFSKIATVACAAIICIGLVGCSGAVSRPATTAGQQPSQPPAGEPPAGAQLSLSAAASDSRPSAGAQFILSATVTNDGEGTLPAVTLSYYRSTDATITTADTEVGTGAVAGLAASGSASASVVLTASATPGTYYYGACVDPVTDESDTTSNCSAAVQVNVLAAEPAEPPMQAQPDLAVASPSVSDRDPAAGAQFTLSVTVRNAGDAAAAATTLRYYRSTDATITTSDTEVATDEVAALAASGSSSESIDVTAPATAGTYYYGACVDPVTGESDITNNCSSSVPVTVSELDLVVATPTVSDSVPAAGATFTLSVRVESAGDGAAATTTLSIYRSTDATITTSDTLVGTVVAELATSATSSQSTRLAASTSSGAYYSGEVELAAPDTPGTYYYGACVDAVTDGADATDNCSPPAQVVVTEPDLVVAATSVSDSGPTAGATFTLSATVRNDGEGASAASTLRYYRSTDATITTSDTAAGTDEVEGLAASGSSRQTVILFAPATAGTYYYGACVDTVTAESDITNNCSTSVPVAVPEPDKPDLKIYAVVAGTNPFDGTVPGGLIQLSVGLRNDGDAAAAATMLRFYRSTDAMITTSDTEERSVEVAALAAAGTTTKEMDVTAPSSPGTYYYGACVDAVTGESDTTNNCSTSVEVTVAQPKSDLVVGEPSVDDDEPAAGASFTLSATVENEGGAAAAATTLRYYRSADATITMFDTEVDTDAIAGLAASASSSQSVELTAPSAPGTYYYGACVDAVTGESDTTNNCSSSVQVTVPEPSASEPTAPDQVAAEVAPSPSAAGAGNGEFHVHWIPSGDGGSAITKYQYRVWETGQTAPATWTDISLSDAALSTQDGKTVFNATGTGITTFDHRDRTLPSGYTVELHAVNTVGPGTAASATLTPATYWFEIEPLSWDEESIDIYPVLVYEGTEVRFRLHVKHNIPNGHVVQANSGFDEPFTLGLAITDTDNALAGSPPSSVLFAGNDTSEDVTLQVAEDDVGADDKEVTLALSSTTTSPSNVFLGRRPPSVPFIVYDNEGPPSTPTNLTASPGDGQVTLTWTTPAGSVASTKHQYCRRTDSAACTVLNWRDIPNSGTGATNANSYTVKRLQNGTEYTFRVRAVHAGGESGVSNEAIATPQAQEPAPDLVVATPTVSDSGPDAGATFTLSATVTNNGDEASAATTLRYYRSTGRVITTSDTEVGTDEVGALAALETSDESVSLTATLPAATYYYGACVGAVTGESDTTNNCSSSVQVTVAAPDKPDLRVYAIVTGTNPFGGTPPGGTIQMSAGVRNQGGVASPATTLRFYQSTDATITTADTEVGTDQVGELAASGTRSHGADVTAPSSTGTYYYGACVDAVTDEFDTTNNCSGSVQVDVSS